MSTNKQAWPGEWVFLYIFIIHPIIPKVIKWPTWWYFPSMLNTWFGFESYYWFTLSSMPTALVCAFVVSGVWPIGNTWSRKTLVLPRHQVSNQYYCSCAWFTVTYFTVEFKHNRWCKDIRQWPQLIKSLKKNICPHQKNLTFFYSHSFFITKQKQCKNKAVAFIFPFMVMFQSIVLMFCPLVYL